MESKKQLAAFLGEKNPETAQDLAAEMDHLAQIITQAQETIKDAADRLNELFENLALNNIKENPYANDLKNSNSLPIGKKLKITKEEDLLLKKHALKGRFRSFAKLYLVIAKRS